VTALSATDSSYVFVLLSICFVSFYNHSEVGSNGTMLSEMTRLQTHLFATKGRHRPAYIMNNNRDDNVTKMQINGHDMLKISRLRLFGHPLCLSLCFSVCIMSCRSWRSAGLYMAPSSESPMNSLDTPYLLIVLYKTHTVRYNRLLRMASSLSQRPKSCAK